MICPQMPPVYGGAGGQAALLGSKLTDRGWKVDALTLDQMGVGSKIENGVHYRRLLKGIEPSGLATRVLTTVMLGVYSFFIVLLRRPAIVHVHGAFWWSIPPIVAAKLIGARSVLKVTRDGGDDPEAVYARRLGPIHIGQIYGLSFRLADAIITLNTGARRKAIAAGLGSRTHLIPNGVDSAALERTQERRNRARHAMNLREGERVVAFVGFLVQHKGVADLVHAWRLVDDRTAQLWLIGPHDGFYRELDDQTLEQVAELIADGYRATLFGHVPREELPRLYWAADVFALPSYAEGMPNSLAEALVAGCDTVATSIPGIVDLMGDETSDLVPPGDVLALADRLRKAMVDPRPAPVSLTRSLGISATAARYDRLYRDLTR